MSQTVNGKTAIVTGAANGVGLAIARMFAENGANVMMVDREEERLEKECATIVDDGGRAQSFTGDLREKLTQANLLSAAIDEFDRVDILVNASRQVLRSDPLEQEQDAVLAMLNQNLLVNLRLSQLLARRMIQQAEDDGDDDSPCIGSIVNLTSIAAHRAQPELLGYSVSCAALDQLTRSLAVALGPHRIRVNAIAIGSLMSTSLRDAMRENEGLRAKVIEATPAGRIGEAAEAAGAALFLASEAAGFVTGQVLSVDGGRSLIDPVKLAAH